MLRRLIAAAVVTCLAVAAAGPFAGLYFTKDSEPGPVTAPQCDNREFGHIRSLARKGDRYELRFDPAFWLNGETANAAAVEDGAIEPGQPVDNDYYIVDESPRTFTYLVRPTAPVTVLVDKGTAGILSTPISVDELSEIVRTGKSSKRKLFESLEGGVWMRYRIDAACGLDQQYRP